MAASTTVIPGIDYLIKAGGSTLGGGRDATLSRTQEIFDSTNKTSANWKKGINSMRSWSMDFTSMYLESSTEVDGQDLAIVTGGSTVKGIKNATVDISMDTADVINTTQGLNRGLVPNVRTVTISCDFDYYDIRGVGATGLSRIQDYIDGTTVAGGSVTVSVGSTSINGTFRATDLTIETPYTDRVMGSFTLEATGAVSLTTGAADAGLNKILNAIFQTAPVPTVTALLVDSVNADNTQWTGQAYVSSVSLNIPYEGAVSMDGTLDGHGALTDS